MIAPIGPYSPIVEADGWLICSGQLGVRDGVMAEGVAAQTAQALKNAEALLAGHGAALGDVVKTLVFLTDMGDFDAMNQAYAAAFADHRPARSAVGVSALPKAGRVEIEVWAIKPNR